MSGARRTGGGPGAAGGWILAAALLAACAAMAGAQEGPPSGGDAFDPFAPGAFEAETGAAVSAAGPAGGDQGAGIAKTEYLVGGTFTVSAAAFFPSSLDGYAAVASASGKLFAKVSVPDYGSLFASFVLSQDFFGGVAGGGAVGLASGLDLDTPDFSLAEFHYSFDIGKKVFLRLGKQLVAWGPSLVWTPVDFINTDRADSFSSVDLREGKAGLRLHIPLSKANLFLFSDFSGLVVGGVTQDPAETVNYAVRFDLAAAGFEFGATGYGGPSAQAKGGLDFSGNLFGSAVYGELAAGPAYSGYGEFVNASLGFSRSLGDLKLWKVSAEGFYNSAGSRLEGAALEAALLTGDAKPLYIGVWYGYASAAGTDFPVKNVDSTLYALANLTDLSFQVSLQESFSLPRLVPFTFILSYLGGGSGREFTALSGGPSFQVSIRTRIAF